MDGLSNMKTLEINKTYKVTDSRSYNPPWWCKNQPDGTIVRCVEDHGNGFYTCMLVDRCGRTDIDAGGWVFMSRNGHVCSIDEEVDNLEDFKRKLSKIIN